MSTRLPTPPPLEVMHLNPKVTPFGVQPPVMNGGTRSTTRPSYMDHDPAPTELITVPDGLIPEHIDVAGLETRDEIIARGTVPEVSPVFAGMRARLARRSIAAAEREHDEWAHTNNVVAYAARSIFKGITGANYLAPGIAPTHPDHPSRDAAQEYAEVTQGLKRNPKDPALIARANRPGFGSMDLSLRPHTPYQLKTMRELERIRAHWRELEAGDYRLTKAYKAAQAHPGSQKPIGNPDFSMTGTFRSPAEARSDRANARHHRNLQNDIHHAEHHFKQVAGLPSQHAERARSRREAMILKEKALSEKAETNRAARQARIGRAAARGRSAASAVKSAPGKIARKLRR